MGQTVPKAYAHYPLTIEQAEHAAFDDYLYVNVHAYDVSGNGHHGFVTGEESFEEKEFLNADGESAYKSTAFDGYIDIPDMFQDELGFLAENLGFTVCFWYYNTGVTDDIIFQSEYVIISSYADSGASGIQVTHGVSGSLRDRKFPTSIPNGVWQFVALTYNQSSGNDIWKVHYYNEESNVTLESNLSSLSVIEIERTSNRDLSAMSNTNSRIMDEQFDGGLRHFRIYSEALSEDQITEIRNLDWNWAMGTYYDDQYITNAIRFYSLDDDLSSGTFADSRNGFSGTINGSAEELIDPDGRAGITSFSSSYISVPSFFYEDQSGLAQYDATQGFSVSFWTYIDDELKSMEDSPYPFDPDNDAGDKIFTIESSATLEEAFSVEIIRDRLVINYYSSTLLATWPVWFIDPVSFTNPVENVDYNETDMTGWFFVVLSFSPEFTTAYMYKPEVDPNSGEQFNARFNYFGVDTQKFDGTTSLDYYLGSPDYESVDNLDDFRVYNWPLTEEEALALHEIDITCTSCTSARLSSQSQAGIEKPVDAIRSVSDKTLIIYPNPADVDVTISFFQEKESIVVWELHDLSGRILAEESGAFEAGRNEITIRIPETAGSIVIFKLTQADGQTYERKILLK